MQKTLVLTGCRSSGLLMHPTSLPGPHGNGDAGPAAHEFVDFLAAAGQRWWQMLPIGPPGAGPGYSPYSSYSAFAASPWLVSLQTLARDGLLSRKDLDAPERVREGEVAAAQAFRLQRLRQAFAAFEQQRGRHQAFDAFRTAHADWLDDFILFSALKSRFGGRSWTRWPLPLRLRRRDALNEARESLAGETRSGLEGRRIYGAHFDLWPDTLRQIVWSFGGDFFGPGGFRDVTLDEPAAQEALQMIARMRLEEGTAFNATGVAREGGEEFYTGNIGCIGL